MVAPSSIVLRYTSDVVDVVPPYPSFLIRFSSGLTLCAHSLQSVSISIIYTLAAYSRPTTIIYPTLAFIAIARLGQSSLDNSCRNSSTARGYDRLLRVYTPLLKNLS